MNWYPTHVASAHISRLFLAQKCVLQFWHCWRVYPRSMRLGNL
ncbi:MAG: hypothetical protein V1728_03420 [Candidatus Micrarchaeota archaeon]